MSAILDFYRREYPDTEGRMLADILRWDDAELEFTHDYIQWLFPLDVESGFNPDAPLLTPEDQAEFRRSALLQSSMRLSLDRFLQFLGLALIDRDEGREQPRIIKAPHFQARLSIWSHPNHNWLRVTRVLKSLRLCSLEAEARRLFDCLTTLHQEGFVSEHSFGFWKEAME